MDEDDFGYERREIQRALNNQPDDHKLTIKIAGDEGASRWLSVSSRQVRAIRELIGGGDLEAVGAALRGELGS